MVAFPTRRSRRRRKRNVSGSVVGTTLQTIFVLVVVVAATTTTRTSTTTRTTVEATAWIARNTYRRQRSSCSKKTGRSAFVGKRSDAARDPPPRPGTPTIIAVAQQQGLASEGEEEDASTTTRRASSSPSAPASPSSPNEAFHRDMLRVLESREAALKPMLERSRQRRYRPVVLESDVDGAERVVAMLQHLISIDQATEESFQIALRAIARRDRMRWYRQQQQPVDRTAGGDDDGGDEGETARNSHRTQLVCAADQAEELLEQLTRLKPPSEISVETYNLVLRAYATCATPRGDRNYASKAEQLLRRMEEGGAFGGRVPVESAMHVLHAHAWEQANLHEGACAQRAQELLERIEAETDDATVLMQCYDWVLEAWSKSGSAGSAEKSDALLTKMKALNETLPALSSEEGDTAIQIATRQLLDAQTYSNAILAWSKANDVQDATQRSTALLKEMIIRYKDGAFPPGSEPPLIAFNGAIAAWSRQGRPDRAEKLLDLLQKTRRMCSHLTTDAVTYNSVLHAHLRSSDKKRALERALALVQYMHDHSSADDQPSIKPNSFTYSTLMKCWIQSGHPNLAEEAEKCLMQMERCWQEGDSAVEPNNRIINMVINAYAKSDNQRFAARKALDLLSRMKASKNPACQPDNISYTSVLECLSKSADPTAPEQAETLLQELFELHQRTGDPEHMPNLRTYTMAILTFAKNNGSVQKARELLSQLVSLYQDTQDPQLRPNEYPYNYVLNCAANALQDQGEAFRVATDVYQEMRKSELVSPDSYTYAFWLKCCNNLLPKGDLREKCVKYAFEECKQNGMLSNELLTRLFQGSPAALVDELLELSRPTNYRELQVNQLPSSWSANARMRTRRR